MPVDDAKRRISSTGFVEWKLILSNPTEYFGYSVDQWHLAQLALEVRRTIMKRKNHPGLKLKNFLLSFVSQQASDPEEESEEEYEKRLAKSKGFWFALAQGLFNKKDKE